MKTLRHLGIFAGVLLFVVAGFIAWLGHDFHESMKTVSWNRDGPPNAEVMKQLAEWDRPDSIYRVVEIGSKSRANGDGEELTIYYFPPFDVPRMKTSLGGEIEWKPGLPEDGGLQWHINQHAPRDLIIDQTVRSEDYIYIPRTPMNNTLTMIDVVRGICYQLVTRT